MATPSIGPEAGLISDFRYVTPLYSKGQAADLIDVPRQTFRNWAVGYVYKRINEPVITAEPLVTTAGAHGPTVPFVGLAEAYARRLS